MMKQAHQQASNHHSKVVRATTTHTHAQGREGPNGGPRCHLSSGQGSGSRHQPREGPTSHFHQGLQEHGRSGRNPGHVTSILR
jgi:hypothetical protein